ncbi:MAG: M48 family metallopeptidase [Flavobacteriales bacterium]|nr:M48 family metallopeptidase [Flavobacteriales bacterium]MCB9447801.1 M48 family metallopeptidase [Flavobacteriales bacterium]
MNSRAWLLTTAVMFAACQKVPITGRSQMNMVPESTMISMSLTNYKDYLKEHPPVSSGDANYQLVSKVGNKIANAVKTYMAQQNLSDRIKGYAWEFNLVNENTVNAWCMPGGKVVVYSGLLPITQSEQGLAVVLGHEIAHAIARHGSERMTQGLLVQLGGIGLSTAMSQKPKETQDLFNQSYGVTSTLGILAYSRKQESEADKMGLVFMAMAGYDPSQAISFWERMAATGGTKPPEILSTHPSDASRIKAIKEYLPEAMKYYKK